MLKEEGMPHCEKSLVLAGAIIELLVLNKKQKALITLTSFIAVSFIITILRFSYEYSLSENPVRDFAQPNREAKRFLHT